MVLLDAVVVLSIVGALVYLTLRLLTPTAEDPRAAVQPGRWRVAHYDTDGETRVVLQKVSDTGVRVLDEHPVAAIPVDDPDYDAKFLAAMSTARERRALFESEDGS